MAAVALRKSCHSKLITFLSQVNTHATTPLPYHLVLTIRDRTKEVMKKAEEYHVELIKACADDAAVATQESAFTPIEGTYQDLMSQLNHLLLILPNPAAAAQAAAASSGGPGVNVKLPTIEVPSFNGNFETWVSFKDLFTATVANNAQLTPAQKLQYLKSALQGEPANLIKSMTITDANYTISWQLLSDRYDNQREIVTSLISKLLFYKKLSQESAQELQVLIDTFSECVRALTVQKLPTDQWDVFLVILVVSKLDPTTRREWAIRQTGTALPTWKELTTFIGNHIRGLLATVTPQQVKLQRQVRVHHITSGQQLCSICNESHHHYQCPELLAKSPSERSSIIKKNHLCFNCLGRDHPVKKCHSKRSCRKCQRRHHTLLHAEQSAATPLYGRKDEQQQEKNGNENISSNHIHVSSQVILKTAVVLVKDYNGVLQPCRIFIDGGSQGEFISEACVNRLQLKRSRKSVSVSGFAAVSVGKTHGEVEISMISRFRTESSLTFNAHILSKLTDFLPSALCRVSKSWFHLQGLDLADPKWNQPGPIDIVIGGRYFGAVMKSDKRSGPPNAPTAFDTIFGWVLTGGAATDGDQQIGSHHIAVEPDIDYLRMFWEIEEPPSSTTLTKEEEDSEQHFQENYTRDSMGRFVVSIPFNSNKLNLGVSRDMAIRRLMQVERRLSRKPHQREQYLKFMEEYQALGHMSKIPADQLPEKTGTTHYLCHHFVENEDSSTTKLRVVFDGSAKSSSGVSLNDTMLVGATLQDDLYDLLLRFRFYPIAMKADIAKMFRQFYLKPEDRQLHRIVWRESPEKPIYDYTLNTVTYGTASATFLSTRCLVQLAEDVSQRFPVASVAIKKQMYIDDLIGGAPTPDDAIEMYNQLNSACEEAGLQLRKWSTNNPTVLATIPEEMRETNPPAFDVEPSVKALGIRWHPTTDQFIFSGFKFDDDKLLTKRVLLSNLARVFDPLGLISCITVRAKLMLQELWKGSIGWDDAAPDTISKKWEQYRLELLLLENIPIPRYLSVENATKYELHAFGDASEVAYGGIIYLKSTSNCEVMVNMITSKTRVAPIKPVTLPRLELCAAYETAKLVVHVKKTMDLDCPVYCWSDSTIVLRWIAANPRRWKTFVSHRVTKIQGLTPIESWRHVPGIDNPADLASRGVPVADLMKNKKWWNGPEWLVSTTVPIFQIPEASVSEDLEERKLPLLVSHISTDLSILNRFSSLLRLQRVTSYVIRYLTALRKKPVPSGPISPSEHEEALWRWVKLVQQQSFLDEWKSLKNGNTVNSNSNLKSLYPFVDHNGILRVTGRLQNANLPAERKHPIILPSNSHLTTLIIQHHHHHLLHAGFQHTWASLQSQFWIVRGRDKVRHFIRKCVTCRRYKAAAAAQLMGNLPTSRVNSSRPFIHCGVDFAGPFNLKNPVGRVPKTYKGYMSIFICMATKAIHLEAVSSLSTSGFLEAFRRFVSRRGLCSHVYSDCGTNFVGAEKEISSMFKLKQTNEDIAEQLSTQGITWHFNPPSAPHQGGLWEAGVKSTKHHLRRIIGNAALTFEMFSTILCQIEAVLNSRPLTPLSSDPGDLSVLTPGHLLLGEPLTTLPEVDVRDIPTNRLNQYQLQQQRIQHLWKRWSMEYLNTLQQRTKWMWESSNVKIGDLVLIVEESAPATWRMGRITEVHPGKDGKVRVVTLRTSSTVLQRPIVKLIPLLQDEH